MKRPRPAVRAGLEALDRETRALRRAHFRDVGNVNDDASAKGYLVVDPWSERIEIPRHRLI